MYAILIYQITHCLVQLEGHKAMMKLLLSKDSNNIAIVSSVSVIQSLSSKTDNKLINKQKYHTVETVPTFHRKIVERDLISTPLAHKYITAPGADPGFQVRGAHLKKLRPAEGGATIFGVFRVKNHDFTPTNLIFSNFRGGGRRVRPPLGYITSRD